MAGKHNPVKRLLRITPGVLAETGIYQIAGDKNQVIHFGRTRYNPRDVVTIFTRPRNEWTIALMVFRKGMRLSVDHAQPDGKCLSELMTASVKEKHKALVARTDPDEITRTGWLAIPRNEFISSVILTDIFEKLGAWDE